MVFKVSGTNNLQTFSLISVTVPTTAYEELNIATTGLKVQLMHGAYMTIVYLPFLVVIDYFLSSISFSSFVVAFV